MKQEIWWFQTGEYKACITDSKLKRRLDFLKDVVLRDHYLYQGRKAWGYTFPAKLYNKIANLLKLPLKTKNLNRVQAGKQSKVADGVERYDLAKVVSTETPLDASKIAVASKDTSSM